MTPTVREFDRSRVPTPQGLASFVWPRSFKDGSPLDLEIGCGVGLHPIQYALANPCRRLIAIEHTREKFESFHRRWTSHDSPSQLLPVHADAVHWVTHALKPETIGRVFLLYPNPEPKAPNQRWLRRPFFAQLLSVVKPGGTITLATNIESYADEAILYATDFWNLSVLERRVLRAVHHPTLSPRTHFEKKYLERGETCFDVTFLKK